MFRCHLIDRDLRMPMTRRMPYACCPYCDNCTGDDNDYDNDYDDDYDNDYDDDGLTWSALFIYFCPICFSHPYHFLYSSSSFFLPFPSSSSFLITLSFSSSDSFSILSYSSYFINFLPAFLIDLPLIFSLAQFLSLLISITAT